METLPQTLHRFDLDINPTAVELLDRYRDQLWMWNERLNLTRHTTLDQFVARDIVDSMKLAELLQPGERILDVGTGGGVPGLVIAILRPDLTAHLCESVAKKARAVQKIVDALGLDIPVHHARAEEVLKSYSYETLVVRAVASIEKLLRWFQPHWGAFDQILVVKGKKWVQERATARHHGLFAGLSLRRVSVYNIPRTDAETVILEIRQKANKS